MLDKIYATIEFNGVQCPVTNMFDIDGDELSDDDTVEQVCRVVAMLPDGNWLGIDAYYTDLRALH